MSFSRTRRAPIVDRNPNNFYRSNQYMATTSYSDYTWNNNHLHRDRPFFDDDAGVGPPPMKRRKAVYDQEAEEREHEGSRSRYIGSYGSSSVGTGPRSSEEDSEFLSRDEIERSSPSRKDGIDCVIETQLRYSYCAYIQSLGMRLEMPQTTIGTAIVLCHRFFLRRSHASHDRFLIATASLFLSAKSEETPCLLNTVLRASCEICQKHNFSFFPYLVYSQDWFEQYRERVTEAEQMILTTLDFELEVQHPYVPLTSVLSKSGLSQTVLLNLAWSLISEGLFPYENNVLTCVIFLPGGLICCSLEAYFVHLKLFNYQAMDAIHDTKIVSSGRIKWLLKYVDYSNPLIQQQRLVCFHVFPLFDINPQDSLVRPSQLYSSSYDLHFFHIQFSSGNSSFAA